MTIDESMKLRLQSYPHDRNPQDEGSICKVV